jgi:hypothetical protein
MLECGCGGLGACPSQKNETGNFLGCILSSGGALSVKPENEISLRYALFSYCTLIWTDEQRNATQAYSV